MANELQAQYTSGKTLYAVLLNLAGQALNSNTPAWEALNATNWTSTKYCHALTEGSTTGIYLANLPTIPTLTPAGQPIKALMYLQAGGSPATTDQWIGTQTLDNAGNIAISDWPLYYPDGMLYFDKA